MSGQHTPGPWKTRASPHGPKYRCVQLGKDEAYTTLELEPADARLIAAAPDLLKACQQALYALKGREHDGFLRDVIAKATGEAA